MKYGNFSSVEKAFITPQSEEEKKARIPYLVVDNFPKLGLLTALRFLEWVQDNPNGVISLPTGKTPEHFIKWTQYFLRHWGDAKARKIRHKNGLTNDEKPEMGGLHFVQIDEFYPIASAQINSFFHFVNKYYIDGFGLNKANALLINAEEIPLYGGKTFYEVFPDLKIDLSLRYREAQSELELLQKRSIFKIDQWCIDYEQKIRDKGGIGFFLGGIGPDGHIAFNTRGSDRFSTTRLMETNFETQAVAASDLGGIDVSRNRLVITIGLQTITANPDVVAIIIAAGEAKAGIVSHSIEDEPVNLYPATSLQGLKNARFYLTKGAASQLQTSIRNYYLDGEWTHAKTEKAVIDLCIKLGKYGRDLTVDDLKNDEFCALIPDLDKHTVASVQASIVEKINRGMVEKEGITYYHTGPHHDDVMLGLLPQIVHQVRSPENDFYFTVMTSGFTAVTNRFAYGALRDTLDFLDAGKIQMLENDPNFFKTGYALQRSKDVYHFLNKIATGENYGRKRALSHRLVRAFVEIYDVKSKTELRQRILEVMRQIKNSYDGEKNPPKLQKLKGVIREFEEELVWAHYGIKVKNVHHLRLGFYTGDIFTEQPERQRDVLPILQQLRDINPDVISLALDPEGSGPDTHYKVLQAIAAAVRLWSKEKDLSDLRIIGYRNVWYRFHPAEADVIVPVSLNTMAGLEDSFSTCYLSQVDAPFPSYMLDGKFSTLAKKIWTDQLSQIQLLLGKKFFFLSEHPRLRACHGILYYREMNVEEFYTQARELEKSLEGGL